MLNPEASLFFYAMSVISKTKFVFDPKDFYALRTRLMSPRCFAFAALF